MPNSTGEVPTKTTKTKKYKVSLPSTASKSAKPIDDINRKEFGSLRITSLQLPEVADCQIGEVYSATIKLRLTGIDERQDTKWDDKKEESVPKGDPYIEGDFRITAIEFSKKSENSKDIE